MKYMKQFCLIMFISFLGEVLHHYLPLPIPASIYGLVILFAGLMTGVVKLSHVEETGRFLIEIMPLMFIPAAVGLLESWGILAPIWIPIIGITLITTVIVMIVSGKITQFVIRLENREEKSFGAKGVEANE
ncbi:lrgA family protein [Clostridium sp. CAG:590]|nr:CidA/LrgA family protein [Clostridium sp.]CCX89219.1 lrgA family protein [Clostridium sp. CAG:590]